MKPSWCSFAVLVTVASIPELLADDQNPYDNPPLTMLESVSQFTNEILLNSPGLLLLLALSMLFGSINFFKDISAPRVHPGRRIGRCLFVWLTANYLFALLFLFLILPDDIGLKAVDKTLFVYCIIATALPEVATNIRLSIGKTDNSLDLYQYKEQVSEIISDRLKFSHDSYRSRQLVCLSYYFYDRLPDFLDRLTIFENQVSLTPEELESLEALKIKLNSKPVGGEVQNVLRLQQQHKILEPKLLSFFDSDIRYFKNSPVSELMRKLGPLLKVDEARKLVSLGITNTTWFLFRCHAPSFRKKITASTEIESNRIENIYHTNRFQVRKRFRRMGVWAISFLAAVWLGASLFSWLNQRLFNSEMADIYGDVPLIQMPLNQNDMSDSLMETERITESEIINEEGDQ
jgi:hypothetical protein